MNINVKNAHIQSVQMCCGNNKPNPSDCNDTFNAIGSAHNLEVRETVVQALRLSLKKGRRATEKEFDTIREDILRKNGLSEQAFAFEPLPETTLKVLSESLSEVIKSSGNDSKTLQSNLMKYYRTEAVVVASSAQAREVQRGAIAVAWYGAALYSKENMESLIKEAGGKGTGVSQALDIGEIIWADSRGYLIGGGKVAAKVSGTMLLNALIDYLFEE